MAVVKTVEMRTEGNSVIVEVTVTPTTYRADSATVTVKKIGTVKEQQVSLTVPSNLKATYRIDGLDPGDYAVKAVCSDRIFSDQPFTIPSTQKDKFTFEEDVP